MVMAKILKSTLSVLVLAAFTFIFCVFIFVRTIDQAGFGQLLCVR